MIAPAERFKQLPAAQRIKSADILFSFLDQVSKSGYVAVDFYDGSIMYDFMNDITTICDIDFFRKKPATNVYTLGALLFNNFFGNFTESEVQLRYSQNQFIPCSFEKWDLNKACYDVALKAVELERTRRYQSIEDFYVAWVLALRTMSK